MKKHTREHGGRSHAGGVVDRFTKGILFAVLFVTCVQVLSIGPGEAVSRIVTSLDGFLPG